jgi:DNA recombination protein RmuC
MYDAGRHPHPDCAGRWSRTDCPLGRLDLDTLLLTLLIVLTGLLLVAVLYLLRLQTRAQEPTVPPTVLTNIQVGLTELQTYTKARHELERQTTDSVRRLEAIIAGTHSKGAVGENIVELAFSKLPPTWQVRNFRVGNKSVEFGLRLSSNLVLPIDSKWPATQQVESLLTCQDLNERRRVKDEINRTVLDKAREVKKYLDPQVTTSFGIAAVPDAVFDLCPQTQVDALKLGVVVISYSMVLPYLLLVFETMLQASQTVDPQKLDACLQNAQQCVRAAQDEIEGRFSKAVTMLVNARNDLSAQLSKLSSTLTSLQRPS